MEKQVVILYALTHGFTDSIPVAKILDFQDFLFEQIENNHNELFETIQTTKDLPAEADLDAAIKEAKDLFMSYNSQSSSAQEKVQSIETEREDSK